MSGTVAKGRDAVEPDLVPADVQHPQRVVLLESLEDHAGCSSAQLAPVQVEFGQVGVFPDVLLQPGSCEVPQPVFG